MKKTLVSLFFLFFVFSSSISYANFSIPDELFVQEHWISLTKSYNIETRTQKLGTLYKRFFSFLLTYDFYDPMNVKTATATARFFSFGAHLDIFDQSNVFIGGIEEKIFTFFPTFDLLASDSSTKLATAKMNFWGTKFYIFDPATGQEMALMSRSFFRFKNDWTINVTNRFLLEQKNIDSRVLMTVIAVQGEIEDWQRERNNNSNLRTATANSAQFTESDHGTLLKQISAISVTQGLIQVDEPSQESLEALAEELDQAFNAENQSNTEETKTNKEQIRAFTAFCLNLVNSNELPNTKKKAILSLLNLRIQGHK